MAEKRTAQNPDWWRGGVLYQIYPGKAGLHETADITVAKIRNQIEALGRTIGNGPGTSPRITHRQEA